MKDKKFVVLVVLGLLWLAMFVGLFFGLKVNPRYQVLISVVCACWFAYWTVSIIRGALRKDKVPTGPMDNLTSKIKPEEPNQNDTAKETPKSE